MSSTRAAVYQKVRTVKGLRGRPSLDMSREAAYRAVMAVRKPVAKRGEVSRERIVQVATELFAQKGYAGAGVDHVAARAKIAKTAIYYHFGNKEGLLSAVLDRLASEWIDGIRAVSTGAHGPIERLDRVVERMRYLVEERPWISKLFQLMALEVAEEKAEIRDTLRSISARAVEAFTEQFAAALRIAPRDAEFMARVLLGQMNSLSLGRQIEPNGVALDPAFAEIRRVMLLLAASCVDASLIPAMELRLEERGAAEVLPAGD